MTIITIQLNMMVLELQIYHLVVDLGVLYMMSPRLCHSASLKLGGEKIEHNLKEPSTKYQGHCNELNR